MKPGGTIRAPARKLIAGAVFGTLALLAALAAFRSAERFLTGDPRFALSDPDNSLLVTGMEHASRRAVERVFAEDFGRSVYLIPVSDRRMTLKTVDWVKDATVARIWPNRVVARIVERRPVAYLELGAGRSALIDEEGVILPPVDERFALTAVVGVRASDPVARRRERVALLLRLLNEIGPPAKDISQVDVSDRDNLKIRQPYEGRVLTLLVGDTHFQLRYANFRNHIAEIRRKLPGASTLDLRLEDRITVVE